MSDIREEVNNDWMPIKPDVETSIYLTKAVVGDIRARIKLIEEDVQSDKMGLAIVMIFSGLALAVLSKIMNKMVISLFGE